MVFKFDHEIGLEPKNKITLKRQIQRNTFSSLFTWKSTRQIPNWNYHPKLQHMKSKKFGMWNWPQHMKSKKVWDVKLANIIQNYNMKSKEFGMWNWPISSKITTYEI